MDKDKRYTNLLKSQIASHKGETRHIEFKSNYLRSEDVGKYISAISNSACLENEEYGYLYFGVDDTTLEVKGTKYDYEHEKYRGNQPLELGLRQHISPKLNFRFEEFSYEDKIRIVVLIIPAASEEPTCLQNIPYVRVRTSVTDLRTYKEEMRIIYNSRKDWSKELVEEATLEDLDPEAMGIAIKGYCERYPKYKEEVRTWTTETFLDRAKLTIKGKITRAALLLLGKEEASHFLGGMRQIVWRLRSSEETEAGEIFGIPFVLSTTKVKEKIRNYRIKIYPDNALLPSEIWKYDTRTILEGLHNAVAHQDYNLGNRIIVTEYPDRLVFENSGSFFEGLPEDYIDGKKTPSNYRNPFLVTAMVNLKMIDTQGYGIHTMYLHQKERFLPMPYYEKDNEKKVSLVIPGTVINKNYSQLLMQDSNIDLTTAVLLDYVQKREPISDKAAKMLRDKKLIEGRKPNYYISKRIANTTEQKAEYTKWKGLNDDFYIQMILTALAQHKKLRKKDFDRILLNKLPDILTPDQKSRKISNLLSKLHKQNKITCTKRIWSLVE